MLAAALVAAMLPAPLTSTGAGLTKQTVSVNVPAGWRMTLDGRDPRYVETVLVPQGFYSRDAPGKVTFTPKLGFVGAASPVTIRLTGPRHQTRVLTYGATVTRPPAPGAPDIGSAGPRGAQQSVTFTVPAGGSIGYLDPPETPYGTFALAMASSIAITPGHPPDDTLIGVTGTVLFTPARGASGPIPPIRYRVTDAYGQTSVGHYTPAFTGYRSRALRNTTVTLG